MTPSAAASDAIFAAQQKQLLRERFSLDSSE